MSKLIPIVAGVTGTAIIGAGGGYLLSTQNTKTIKDSFKPALIKLDNSEEELLKIKLTKLKTGTIFSGNKKLKEAQDKEKTTTNSGLADLKKACQEIYDSGFTNKNSDTFKDFQAYCAKTNKDKVAKGKWAIDDSTAQWKTKHEKLKNPKSSLIAELNQIANTKSTNGEELKTWCKNNGELVFEGDEDKTFKNIEEFCTKDS
ncbi:hypothetical protein A6V39_05200 [Candidatus Mycoplasma haematobovis]|uniref:Uncharacterized protein n=1 Tax=Candidatus Mycoplasma haematobovis TaxID=432608 RepID=A0A1A9QCZ6_9MOLU|nr:hypothetical protein [Candidatus Mycoplasma haematobovis]OAL09825.1 hypothetical protein A6V39_05200 [Candidatus Mycoplasma haematobovis]